MSIDAATRVCDLLDHAEQAVRDDPERAADLAIEAHDLAVVVAPELLGRALYIRAQADAASGRLAEALQRIDAAAVELRRHGQVLAACRTALGRANVLGEMGRSEEALATLRALLVELDEHAAGDGSHPETAGDLPARLRAAALQNLGLLHTMAGDAPSALRAYDEALDLYRVLGQRVDVSREIGEVGYDRGLVHLAQGRAGAAVEAFSAAASCFADGGFRALQAAALIAAADGELLAGRYQVALDTLHDARGVLTQIAAPERDQAHELVAARAYLALNLLPEALSTYRVAAEWFAESGMVVEEARARLGIAVALRGRGAFEEALVALDAAEACANAASSRRVLVAVAVERGEIALAVGDAALARQCAIDAAGIDDPAEHPVEAVRAQLLLAALDGADHGEALDAADRIADELGLAPLRVAVAIERARDQLARSESQAAHATARTALSIAESMWRSLAHDSVVSLFFADKTALDRVLVRAELDLGHVQRAADAADRARNRTLDRLGPRAVPEQSGSFVPVADDPRRTELDMIYVALLEQATTADVRAGLRSRASEIETSLRRDELAPPADPSPGDERTRTAAGHRPDPNDSEVVPTVAYFTLDTEIVAFVHHTDVDAIALAPIAQVQALVDRLDEHLDQFRLGPDFARRHADRLAATARSILRSLHDVLFAPVRDLLGENEGQPRALLIVPHGILHAVPFHALCGPEHDLIDEWIISYAPSVASARASVTTPARSGVLTVGYADDHIPAVRREVAAVRSGASSAGVVALEDDDATTSAFRDLAPTAGVVHVASHGVFRVDNPMYSALRFADRWLTAREIASLDLRGCTLVLSGCETARRSTRGTTDGSDASGFVRAAMQAGAPHLIASLWRADDEATTALMAHLVPALGATSAADPNTADPAAALRAAQRAVRRDHPHPYHWAPFVSFGSPSTIRSST